MLTEHKRDCMALLHRNIDLEKEDEDMNWNGMHNNGLYAKSGYGR